MTVTLARKIDKEQAEQVINAIKLDAKTLEQTTAAQLEEQRNLAGKLGYNPAGLDEAIMNAGSSPSGFTDAIYQADIMHKVEKAKAAASGGVFADAPSAAASQTAIELAVVKNPSGTSEQHLGDAIIIDANGLDAGTSLAGIFGDVPNRGKGLSV